MRVTPGPLPTTVETSSRGRHWMSGGCSKRRISFSAESVLTAVIQDADTSELVRILDNHGDEVRVNRVNHVGLTALHHGVLSNNLDTVKLLLCNGADVNAQDVHGFSPLHTAAACGFTQVASMLVLYGADVFALTAQKEMPIDVAKDIGVIRLLSEEMRRRFHQQLFLSSFLQRKASDGWAYVKQGALRLMDDVFQLVLHLWKRHRTKSPVGRLEIQKEDPTKRDLLKQSRSQLSWRPELVTLFGALPKNLKSAKT
ncbi:hypothetical protein Btru_034945 [Bulinus truncatus]|nr:hypothetical protein Btru_034945 [Bulinus truncatus]